MLPNFLGLGAARSGSTWIARNLMEHPDVYLPRKKELHFFDKYYEEGIGAYEHEFAGWKQQKAVGEITPEYFYMEAITPLIKKHLPNVKMFVSLRDPVDRAYSHYLRLIAVSAFGENEQPSFEESLEISKEILEVGNYYKHITRFYDYFEPQQLKVVFFEQLRAQPLEFLAQILEYLEVDVKFNESLMNQRINAAASLSGLAKSEKVWILERVFRRLGIYSVTDKLEKANRSKIAPMNPKTSDWLIKYYEEPNRQLEKLLGCDLSAWSQPA